MNLEYSYATLHVLRYNTKIIRSHETADQFYIIARTGNFYKINIYNQLDENRRRSEFLGHSVAHKYTTRDKRPVLSADGARVFSISVSRASIFLPLDYHCLLVPRLCTDDELKCADLRGRVYTRTHKRGASTCSNNNRSESESDEATGRSEREFQPLPEENIRGASIHIPGHLLRAHPLHERPRNRPGECLRIYEM